MSRVVRVARPLRVKTLKPEFFPVEDGFVARARYAGRVYALVLEHPARAGPQGRPTVWMHEWAQLTMLTRLFITGVNSLLKELQAAGFRSVDPAALAVWAGARARAARIYNVEYTNDLGAPIVLRPRRGAGAVYVYVRAGMIEPDLPGVPRPGPEDWYKLRAAGIRFPEVYAEASGITKDLHAWEARVYLRPERLPRTAPERLADELRGLRHLAERALREGEPARVLGEAGFRVEEGPGPAVGGLPSKIYTAARELGPGHRHYLFLFINRH